MSVARPSRELVRVAAGLRVALVRGAMRGGKGATARRVGLVLGALVGGVAAIATVAVLTVARGHGRLPEDMTVVLFCVLVAGWVVLPVLTFGSDDLLDPARLVLLPLSGPQLVTVMGVGALIGVAPVAGLVAALGVVPATADDAGSGLIAVLAAFLLIALCVTASRTCVCALSGLLRSRRGRDLGVALTAVVALGFQLANPLIQLALRTGGGGEDILSGPAGPLAWTPPGLLATAPNRPLPAALASLLGVAALIVVLLVAWERLLRRSLERPDTSGGRRRATSLDPRGVPVPAGRAGAIMAKDLRYLGREPKRLINTVVSGLLPVLAIVLGPVALSGGRPPEALVFAVTGMGLLAGIAGANRFGLDGSATWLLISSATDRRDARRDLLGGDLAATAVMVPFLVAIATVLAAISNGWAYLAPAVGLALTCYGVGLGAADVLSVRAPVALPQGQNAFGGGGAGQGCTAGLLMMAAMLVEVVVSLPVALLLIPQLVTGQPLWGLAVLVIGPVYGFAIGELGRRSAARQWATRGPEVLEVVTAGGA